MPPTRALRYCAHPGCGALVTSGPCEKHRATREQHRGTRQERGYGRRHEKWRKRILRRDPLCVRCLEQGRTTPATVADHIVPWQQGGSKYGMDNGRGLCAPCHNKVRSEQGVG